MVMLPEELFGPMGDVLPDELPEELPDEEPPDEDELPVDEATAGSPNTLPFPKGAATLCCPMMTLLKEQERQLASLKGAVPLLLAWQSGARVSVPLPAGMDKLGKLSAKEMAKVCTRWAPGKPLMRSLVQASKAMPAIW